MKPLTAFLKNVGSAIVPFATVNIPALIKLRKWVGIDKIVFAICDAAFGASNKVLYKYVAADSADDAASLPLIAPAKPLGTSFACSIPSAISFEVQLSNISLSTYWIPGNLFSLR